MIHQKIHYLQLFKLFKKMTDFAIEQWPSRQPENSVLQEKSFTC